MRTIVAMLPVLVSVASAPAAASPDHARILAPADVQETQAPSGGSPFEGEVVAVQGVVTGLSPHGRFYYLADPAGGAWSGVKVEGNALERVFGESVAVRGRVVEVDGETRLEELNARSFGAGQLPEAAAVTLEQISTDSERWEGVLVRVADITVLGFTSRYGEFPVQDASGFSMLVDDEFYTSYIADPGDTFASIAGIISYGYSGFYLEPRSDADLQGWTSGRDFDAVLEVAIRDGEDRPLPAKVTLFPTDGSDLELGPDDRYEGSEDAAFIPSGDGQIRLPSGVYDVVVSRGIEYGLHEERITIAPGGTAHLFARLEREVDTSGWLSADLHVHCAPSFDTPLPVPGRIASLAAEGVEWAVATDHNMVTDYTPVIAELGLADWMTSSIGDEITTYTPSFGHFNAWPLAKGSVPPPYLGQSPAGLFQAVRTDPGTEIVQVNHPTIPGSPTQYFNLYQVSRFTGEPAVPGFSFDFDALEIMNGRYIEQGLVNIEIWMAMLNAGREITATGNSDSHHLVFREPGYPRNFVASLDEPATAREEDLVQAVLAGRSYVTYGPALDFTIHGAGLGELVGTVEGEAVCECRVQCPSWLRVDTARIYGNGEILASFELSAPPTGPQVSEFTWTDLPEHDTWYVLFVEGPGDLAPVMRGSGFRPLAFTNPIRVDADGDGVFTPPGNSAEPLTIAELCTNDPDGVPLRMGEWIEIEGCATTRTGFYDPSLGNFYLDDGTGGVQVREEPPLVTGIERGDEVVAAGFVTQLLGETILGDAVVQVIGAGTGCPPAIPATTGGIAAAGEALEGRVVQIEGADRVGGQWPVGGVEGQVVIDDGTGPIALYIPAGVVVPPEAASLEDFIFTALVTQLDFSPPYLSDYQLTLRDGADLFPPSGVAAPGWNVPGGGPYFGRPRPNPFRDRVSVPYRLTAGEPGAARCEIFDIHGRRLRTLEIAPDQGGSGFVVWDGRDGRGRVLASGVYFLRLATPADTWNRRLVKVE